MSQSRHAPVPVLLLSLAVLLSCDDDVIRPDAAPAGTPPTPRAMAVAVLDCTADARAGTLRCAPAAAATGLPEGASAVLLGGQGENVLMHSDNVTWDSGIDVMYADVWVQNCIAQPLGTVNGATLHGDGVRVILHREPTNGVTLTNATGAGTFLRTETPYVEYEGNRALFGDPVQGQARNTDGSGGENACTATPTDAQVTETKTWTFQMNRASTFTFGVYVSAAVPFEDGWLEVIPLSLRAGATEQAGVVARNVLGDDSGSGVTWSVPAGNGVASVDAAGMVSGAAVGRTTLTATSGSAPPVTVALEVVPPHVLFVDGSATGAGDGSSWTDAYSDIRGAMTAAVASGGSITELWVAAGRYTPSSSGDQTIAFELANGIGLYGGFTGTELFRMERDWEANETTLSGDLAGDDGPDFAGRADNAGLIVHARNVDGTAILDGFTISGGHEGSQQYGGGVFVDHASPVLRNLRITDNAGIGGGGVGLDGAAPVLTNVTIADNTAAYGGGMVFWESSAVLTNVIISGNRSTSTSGGGGIYINGGNGGTMTNVLIHANRTGGEGGGIFTDVPDTPWTLTNVTITGNTAAEGFGGIKPEGVIIRNSIIWGNVAPHNPNIWEVVPTPITNSIIQGSGGSAAWISSFGDDGGGNLDADPLFTSPGGGVYTLQVGSPAIGAGDDTFIAGVTTDVAGNPRQVGTVDMGPYEYQGGTSPAIGLDGSTGYGVAPASPWLNTADNISIDLWTRPSDATGPLVEYVDGSGDLGVHLWQYPDDRGLMVNFVDTEGNGHRLEAADVLTPGVWLNIVAVYRGSTSEAELYVNGTLVADTVFEASFTLNTDGAVYLGHLPGSLYYGGALDEVRIWDHALGGAEVAAVWNRPVSGAALAVMAGYWPIDEGSGATLTDVSGNGNTMTLQGGFSWSSR